jgi:hypothetical protein
MAKKKKSKSKAKGGTAKAAVSSRLKTKVTTPKRKAGKSYITKSGR